MPKEPKDDSNDDDARISDVIEKAKQLASELKDTAQELAELLKNYTEEIDDGASV